MNQFVRFDLFLKAAINAFRFMTYRTILLGFVFILGNLTFTAQAQQRKLMENQALAELQKTGISEQELRDYLLEKGIDIDQANSLSAEQAIQLQAEIETAVKELEAKKKNENRTKTAPTAIDDHKIQNRIQAKNKQQEPSVIANKVGGIQLDSLKDQEGKLPIINDTVAIWGQHIFRNKSLALYRQANDIKPPSSYVLGVGDQITVSIYGYSQLNETYELNAEGYILPTRMPRIFLEGVTLGRA